VIKTPRSGPETHNSKPLGYPFKCDDGLPDQVGTLQFFADVALGAETPKSLSFQRLLVVTRPSAGLNEPGPVAEPSRFAAAGGRDERWLAVPELPIKSTESSPAQRRPGVLRHHEFGL